jgi:hypothetical protein
MPPKSPTPKASDLPALFGGDLLPRVFAALFGGFLGLGLLKFGNPPIMEKYTTTPEDIYQVIFASPWPIGWAYILLGGLVIAGLLAVRWRRAAPLWITGLALTWLGWQILAASRSIDPALSAATVRHFCACVTCFLLGWFALSACDRMGLFWSGLMGGLMVVLLIGWEQHFGGLQRTRDYFYLYIYPTMNEVPPEYLKKISSNRIFSTLFYPNSLAGALLLLLPCSLGVLWNSSRTRFTQPARIMLLAVVAILALACLFWSGSKGGWLLMLLLAIAAMLRLPLKTSLKISIVAFVLVCGMAGFAWKYADFFKKGATSVGARFDYWRAAVQVAKENAVYGTGPGTFAKPYAQIKDPDSEMTRLVHNDYLEQASDSGVIGFAAYIAFIVIAIAYAYPNGQNGDWIRFGTWLGLAGWSLQSLIDFSLYVPAIAWCAFALLGWLLGTRLRRAASGSDIDIDKSVDRS